MNIGRLTMPETDEYMGLFPLPPCQVDALTNVSILCADASWAKGRGWYCHGWGCRRWAVALSVAAVLHTWQAMWDRAHSRHLQLKALLPSMLSVSLGPRPGLRPLQCCGLCLEPLAPMPGSHCRAGLLTQARPQIPTPRSLQPRTRKLSPRQRAGVRRVIWRP